MPVEATSVSAGSSHSLPRILSRYTASFLQVVLHLQLQGGGGQGCEEEKEKQKGKVRGRAATREE